MQPIIADMFRWFLGVAIVSTAYLVIVFTVLHLLRTRAKSLD